jgi:hypothetical protein
MTNNVQNLPTEEAKAIAKDGELFSELADTYTRLYQIQGTLKCAFPGLERGTAPALDTVYLCADLIGELAEKLDLLTHRI